MLPPSSLVISQEWGLIDLPLRASNEGSPRPRVARAQETLSPSPRFTPFIHIEEWPRLPFTTSIERAHSDRARSASKKGTWLLLTSFPASPIPQSNARRLSSHRRLGPSRSIRLGHGSHAQAG